MLKCITVRTAVLLGTTTMVLLGASPATAGDGWGGIDCSSTPSAPGCEVSAGQPGGNAGGNAGPGSSSGGDGGAGGESLCYYDAVDTDHPAPPGGNPNGGWYVRVCPFGDGGTYQSEAMWLDDAPPAVRPEDLAREAVSRLALPVVRIRLNPRGDQLVNLPTWLGLERSSWVSVSATASVPGVSVTATARPVRAVWSLGDGGSVTCAGPGAVWRPGTDPRRASPDCGHTYRRSSAGSPGAAYPVRVSVSWAVTWAGAGSSGTVAGLATTGAVSVRVRESQAVIAG